MFYRGAGGREPTCQGRRQKQVRSLGREDLLEENMATHSSILAWRIPWTEEEEDCLQRRLALPLSRHLLTGRHGSTNRLYVHPSFLLLVVLRCPIWNPVSTMEGILWGQCWLPRLKELRGTESPRSRILEKRKPGGGSKTLSKINSASC